MIVITLARKPLSGTVASNAQKYGTGGINIDGCRIQGGPSDGGSVSGVSALGQGSGWNPHNNRAVVIDRSMTQGRWPANLVLEHKPSCRCIGTTQVKTGMALQSGRDTEELKSHNKWGHKRSVEDQGYASGDGTETISAWDCEPDCPVAGLDQQSGFLHPSGNVGDTGAGSDRGYQATSYQVSYQGRANRDLGDRGGGASRFFHQVQGGSDIMTGVPQQLTDYLVKLISPPPRFGQAVLLGDLASVSWDKIASWKDSSITGIILRGQPTPEQATELLRVLTPGGHLCVIAPENEPLGYVGACAVEDAGFEIRDSILWIREAGSSYYVAKPARSEREAGCSGLPSRSGAEAVDRKEGSDGMKSPRAGAGRTAEEVKNHHVTVKPIKIMESLLNDVLVDPDHPILDPFMGSGTTGIACIKTGHPFIGIERESDYMMIADARIRHWAAEGNGLGPETVIESDVMSVVEEPPTLDFWSDTEE